jgi:hypothetical protein
MQKNHTDAIHRAQLWQNQAARRVGIAHHFAPEPMTQWWAVPTLQMPTPHANEVAA